MVGILERRTNHPAFNTRQKPFSTLYYMCHISSHENNFKAKYVEKITIRSVYTGTAMDEAILNYAFLNF